jgi:hypothetical protein
MGQMVSCKGSLEHIVQVRKRTGQRRLLHRTHDQPALFFLCEGGVRGSGCSVQAHLCDGAGVDEAGKSIHGYIRSKMIAKASPPPIHRLANPRRAPRASIAYSNVVMMRAPVAPIGWPSAIAPP